MKDPLVYIDDILDAMDKAEAFVSGMDYDHFEEDVRTAFAVIRALEIIGEAVKRLSPEFRERYPHIPWKEMAGMRDKIIHGYDQVDLRIVWKVVQQDIPRLKPQFRQILSEFAEEED